MSESADFSKLMAYQDIIGLIFFFFIPIVVFVICFHFSKKMFHKNKFSRTVRYLIVLMATILFSNILLFLFGRVLDLPGKLADFLVRLITP